MGGTILASRLNLPSSLYDLVDKAVICANVQAVLGSRAQRLFTRRRAERCFRYGADGFRYGADGYSTHATQPTFGAPPK